MTSFFPNRSRPEPERKEGLAPNGLPWESVWDYPRPPVIRPEPRPVTVRAGTTPVARSERAIRVCETAGSPVVYLPREDLEGETLRPSAGGGTFCEWKGAAEYLDVVTPEGVIARAAWSYPSPSPGFGELAGHVAFYPGLVECRLAGELVRPQPGGFYGGWMTDEILGPVKGEPGTGGW